MTERDPKYAGYKPRMRVSIGSDEFSAVHLDQSLGCVLGSFAGDVAGSADLDDSGFGSAISLSIVEALAHIEAGGVEQTRPVLFDKLQEWYSAFYGGDGPLVGEMVVGVTDPRGFEGAAERYMAAFPDRFCDSSVVSRAGFSAARWLHAQDVGATQHVGRRFCSVTHANPKATEARALMQAIVRWQRAADRQPTSLEFHVEHALARAIPEYRDYVRQVFTPGTPDDWPSDGAWTCLSNAVDVVRTTQNFEEAISAAVEVPEDSRSVAIVVGAIAGARYGASRIPSSMTAQIRGTVLEIPYGTSDLEKLHDRLVEVPSEAMSENMLALRMRRDFRDGVPISRREEEFLRRFSPDLFVEELDAHNDEA